MIEFMVIGLPRSGTTWAANWMMTEKTFCVHDPLWTMHHSDMDRVVSERAGDRLPGVACTGLWQWGDVVNTHPARKLILHRPLRDIRAALRRIGLPVPLLNATAALDRIDGLHVPFEDLFRSRTAEDIWDYLTDGLPFDATRHAELVQMSIQPQFDRIRRDPALNRRLATELRQ